jgi:hypothetical protein
MEDKITDLEKKLEVAREALKYSLPTSDDCADMRIKKALAIIDGKETEK